MTLAYSLEESIRNTLFKEGGIRDYEVNVDLPHYEDNSIYSRFFEIIVPCEGTCFIPVLGMRATLNLIRYRFEQESPQPIKISYPLYVGAIDTKRTADSIIQSINRCPVRASLCNIKTSIGLDYYGGQGLIFDENWAPLMICGFIIDIGKDLIDFSQTAAAMANLDLVICNDTSLAHLAGAMGIPCWVLLPYEVNWRWHTDLSVCDWYDSIKLFRQHKQNDWNGVFEDVLEEMHE